MFVNVDLKNRYMLYLLKLENKKGQPRCKLENIKNKNKKKVGWNSNEGGVCRDSG